MKKPSTQVMVVGHPVIAVPMSLVSGIGLLAGLHASSVLLVLLTFAMIARIRSCSEQASAYRAWKADWDGMSGASPRRSGVVRGVLKVIVIALLMLGAFTARYTLAHMVGYGLGWTSRQPWLLTGLGLLAVALIVQFIRCYPRRPKAAKPVTVIAKAILPVPSLADAYRALPPYCQHLLGRQQ